MDVVDVEIANGEVLNAPYALLAMPVSAIMVKISKQK